MCNRGHFTERAYSNPTQIFSLYSDFSFSISMISNHFIKRAVQTSCKQILFCMEETDVAFEWREGK